MSDLKLYELAGADPEVRFSPHCWKIRMALAHKGLTAERIPWRFMDKEAISFSKKKLVPVLVDGDEVVEGSWDIALHLDRRYPDAPALLAGEAVASLAGFVNAWSDMTLLPLVLPIILLDVHDALTPEDQVYFRQTREARLGNSLETIVANRPRHLAALSAGLSPLRRHLKGSAFIAGDEPSYADYAVFGVFMWARCTSPAELLSPDDTVFAWRERLLDLFDGMAGTAPKASFVEARSALEAAPTA